MRHHTAQQLYREFLSKAGGEGSRGGSVIGHTDSGKPIYSRDHKTNKNMYTAARAAVKQSRADSASQHSNVVEKERKLNDTLAAYAREHHPTYTSDDHRDAAHAHHQVVRRAGDRADVLRWAHEKAVKGRDDKDR